MTSHAMVNSGLQFGSALLRLFSRLLPHGGPVSDAEQAEARARRDFILEMMERHPSAFASEHDVQSMMRLYPDRF